MIFKSGSAINTIKGADTRGLTNAIEAAAKLAGAATPVYTSVGRTLGGTPSRGTSLSQPFNYKKFMDSIIAFLALYFTTLFSFDAYGAGESSPFNINRTPAPSTAGGRRGGKRASVVPQGGKKVGTLADLGGD